MPKTLEERQHNLTVRERELEAGALELTARPTRVWFALTGRCNLACVHCPRIAGVEPDIDMGDDLFERITEQVFPFADQVEFGGNNLGEQIIHPRFAPALKAIHESGSRILLTTNATKLTPELADLLASAGVRLRISVEGVGSTYEQVRKVSWDKLVGSLRAYKEACARHQDKNPTLEFALTAFAGNVRELPELLDVANDLGADHVYVHHLLPKTKSQELQSLFFHRSSANAAFGTAEQRANELGLRLTLPARLDEGTIALDTKAMADPPPEAPKRKLEPCYLPWTSVNVLENGDVLPCCVGGSLIMGNLKKNTFEEIWNGPAYKRLRKTVNSDRPNSVCAACAMRGGASDQTYTVLLHRNLIGKFKTSLKSYLLRTKRKKTLQRLIKVRDGVTRALARF